MVGLRRCIDGTQPLPPPTPSNWRTYLPAHTLTGAATGPAAFLPPRRLIRPARLVSAPAAGSTRITEAAIHAAAAPLPLPAHTR